MYVNQSVNLEQLLILRSSTRIYSADNWLFLVKCGFQRCEECRMHVSLGHPYAGCFPFTELFLLTYYLKSCWSSLQYRDFTNVSPIPIAQLLPGKKSNSFQIGLAAILDSWEGFSKMVSNARTTQFDRKFHSELFNQGLTYYIFLLCKCNFLRDDVGINCLNSFSLIEPPDAAFGSGKSAWHLVCAQM